MDFFEVIERRQSIRAYTDRGVEPAQLDQILRAANRAPSAGNLQAYEIVVVRDAVLKRALIEAAGGQEQAGAVPVVLVFCANPARSAPKYHQRGERLYSVQDATIACTFAMLAATALGLATVWVGAFDDEAVKTALSLPKGWLPVAMLPVGYAAESPLPSPRRDLHDLVHEGG
jgi:nitroreductase